MAHLKLSYRLEFGAGSHEPSRVREDFFRGAGAQHICTTPYEASLNDGSATERRSVFPVQ